MRLPPDYPEIVTAGVATLRAVSTEVRGTATVQPDAPELWLIVRDLEGLAGRLADLDEREWHDGFGATFVTGQDLGVLDELLNVGVLLQASSLVSLTPEQTMRLTRLREFLQRYRDRSYDADSPAA
jgi:hypothetical protein